MWIARSGGSGPKHEGPGYPAEKARQGRIVLNTPMRRGLFFGGLVAFVVIAIGVALLGLR